MSNNLHKRRVDKSANRARKPTKLTPKFFGNTKGSGGKKRMTVAKVVRTIDVGRYGALLVTRVVASKSGHEPIGVRIDPEVLEVVKAEVKKALAAYPERSNERPAAQNAGSLFVVPSRGMLNAVYKVAEIALRVHRKMLQRLALRASLVLGGAVCVVGVIVVVSALKP